MDYRKMINNKKKLATTVESIKKLAFDKSKEVKEYTGSTVEELKENVKSTAKDVKTMVSNSVKTKLTNEFRKNYPAYAISYIDDLIVNAFASDVPKLVISKNVREGSITIENIIEEIAKGMVSEDILGIYKTEKVVNSLFDYLDTYYSREVQLKVVVINDEIVISMPIEKESMENIEE